MIKFTLICLSLLCVFIITGIVNWTISDSYRDALHDTLQKYGSRIIGNENQRLAKIYSNEWMLPNKNYSNYGDGSCKNFAISGCTILFKVWMKIAKEYGITYSLTHGSLLGAYRDSKFIPYDMDADVLVDLEEMHKLERASEERNFGLDGKIHFVIQKDWRKPQDDRRRINCKGEIVGKMVDECSFIEPVARVVYARNSGSALHFDVFAFVKSYNSIRCLTDEHVEFLLEDYYPFKKCHYLGTETWCPNNGEKILKRLYGKNLAPLKKCFNTKWIKQ